MRSEGELGYALRLRSGTGDLFLFGFDYALPNFNKTVNIFTHIKEKIIQGLTRAKKIELKK